MWAVILEAANFDPLRAQEMEEKLGKDWWIRYLANRKAQQKAIEAKKRG